jgi:hypothetical protein
MSHPYLDRKHEAGSRHFFREVLSHNVPIDRKPSEEIDPFYVLP